MGASFTCRRRSARPTEQQRPLRQREILQIVDELDPLQRHQVVWALVPPFVVNRLDGLFQWAVRKVIRILALRKLWSRIGRSRSVAIRIEWSAIGRYLHRYRLIFNRVKREQGVLRNVDA